MPRSRHGPDQSRAVPRRRAAVRPDARGACRRPADHRDPAPGLQHQPVLQRGPDPRPRAVRLAPGRCRASGPRPYWSSELWETLSALPTEEEQKLALRRFRQRESLRIGYNDIVRGFPLEVITQDLSHLADACVEAAVRLARAHAEARFGVPTTPRGSPARFVVLGLGKLGGEELNYSSDIDLIFLYDEEGQTTGPEGRLQRRVLRADGERDRPPARRAHRAGDGLSRRHAAPSGRGTGRDGPLARLDARLLRDPGPDLGTPGADQVPAGRRRPGAGPDVSGGDHAVRLSPIPRGRGDRRDQGPQASDRAAHRLGRDGRGRGQDRPRRHPRRRVRRPVPPAPPRRRVPRGPRTATRSTPSPSSSGSAA